MEGVTAMTPTIAHAVEQFSAERAKATPPSASPSPFALDQARLEADGVPPGVIAVGSVLDDSAVVDANGRATTLYDVVSDTTSVLVFYRGAWCPYCNLALRNYQSELLPELNKSGVRLVALTPQVSDASLSLIEKNELSFEVLTDIGNQLARTVGILARPSAAVLEAQRARGLDIALNNDLHTADLPMPTAIILDAAHTVQFIDVHPNYTTRTEADQILAALKELQ
jgi:peroxiredoxin